MSSTTQYVASRIHYVTSTIPYVLSTILHIIILGIESNEDLFAGFITSNNYVANLTWEVSDSAKKSLLDPIPRIIMLRIVLKTYGIVQVLFDTLLVRFDT